MRLALFWRDGRQRCSVVEGKSRHGGERECKLRSMRRHVEPGQLCWVGGVPPDQGFCCTLHVVLRRGKDFKPSFDLPVSQADLHRWVLRLLKASAWAVFLSAASQVWSVARFVLTSPCFPSRLRSRRLSPAYLISSLPSCGKTTGTVFRSSPF